MARGTLTTIAAYGAFALAEHFHFSGVIATVAAGMLCGNYGARTGMSPSTRIAVESFWDYVAFALNSVVFLLIGFEVHLGDLLASWKPIVIAYLAVTIGRAALIYLVTFGLRWTHEAMPWSWSARPFVHPDSRAQHGTSAQMAQDRRQPRRERVAIRAKSAALAALEGLVKGSAKEEAEQRVKNLHIQDVELQAEEEHAARRHLLIVEKDTVLSAYHQGHLSQQALEQLLVDVDARLHDLESKAT